MTLLEQMDQDYLAAMKSRDTAKVDTLRLIKSATKNEAIKISGLGYQLSEAETLAVLNREAKQRHEAIEQYKAAGRQDLVDSEQQELTIIESYLPKAMSDDELAQIVEQVIAETGATQKSDMGKVMGALKSKIENPADVSRAAALVNQKLS